MSTTTSGRDEQPRIPDAAVLGRGLAALRIFMGVIFFANGLSKLFGFRNIEIGPTARF